MEQINRSDEKTNLHTDDKEVKGDEFEEALSVFAQKTKSDWLTLDVEPAVGQFRIVSCGQR